MLPARIHTGCANRTIPNPALLAGTVTQFGAFEGCREVYQGPVDGYDFRKQFPKKNALQVILRRNGRRFTEVSGLLYNGNSGYNQRFVVLTGNPKILWYKYVGFAAMSGQNHMYIHGMRLQTTLFLVLEPSVQDALLRNDMEEVDKLKGAGWRSKMDDSTRLWN